MCIYIYILNLDGSYCDAWRLKALVQLQAVLFLTPAQRCAVMSPHFGPRWTEDHGPMRAMDRWTMDQTPFKHC